MNKIELIENPKPQLKKIKFHCDKQIDKKLNEYPLFRDFLNKQNATCFIGLQGSGKTSLMINFLTNKELYYKCFENIYVFMRESSRNSIAKNPFENLDEENGNKKFEDLTEENLDYVYSKIKENTDKGEWSLIIFDDVQDNLKNVDVAIKLNNIIANQRHLRSVSFIILQNYYALPKKTRQLVNNIIFFKLDKTQMEQLFNEVFEKKFKDFENIVEYSFDKPHEWLFLNKNTQRIFKGFDEIILKK